MKQSEYQVLARKYRPQSFSELVGQESLVKILNNSIKLNKVAHAFLLTGIRGIGKTTTARIIAKTLNCQDLQESSDGFTPCNKCKNCLSFINQSHPDVIEIDAASKTGVSDIREVIENGNYAPILGKYKIYIIDEVHMLSNSAFNALLKTLEEPPAHLKFIFATTEYRKIPLTIVSRCQKYDLKSFDKNSLFHLLKKICEKENVKVEDEALNIISEMANGSARDALSLLDTSILNSNNNEISAIFTKKLLGLYSETSNYQLFSLLVDGDTEGSLKHLHQLSQESVDLYYLIEDLLKICTEAAKAKASLDFLNSVSTSERTILDKVVSTHSMTRISNIWQMLYRTSLQIKNSDISIQMVEMLFIRICYLADSPTPLEIFHELKKNSNLGKVEANNSQKQVGKTEEQQPNKQATDLKDILDIFLKNKEPILYHHLKNDFIIHDITDNKIVFSPHNGLSNDIVKQVKSTLEKLTGRLWHFNLAENDEKQSGFTAKEKELEEIKNNEIIKSIFDNFPNARIENIKSIKNN